MIQTFRIVALLEGLSYILLVFIAMPVEDLNFNPIHLTDHDSVNFSIYPNPSKDSFKINFSDDDAFLKITDLNGRLIYQKMGPFNNTEINHLNNGHYIVTVITNDDIFAKQFIVNK